MAENVITDLTISDVSYFNMSGSTVRFSVNNDPHFSSWSLYSNQAMTVTINQETGLIELNICRAIRI